MKHLTLALFLLFSLTASSQIKTVSPTGTRISFTPGVSMSGIGSETILFSDVIRANNLLVGKYYPFRIDLSITTPAVNLASLTFRIKYGGQVMTIMNNSTLVGGLTLAPITISGYLVARTNGTQFIPVTVTQPAGSAVSVSFSNSNFRGNMTVDATLDQTFSVTAQVGGVGLGATSIFVDWVYRGEF